MSNPFAQAGGWEAFGRPTAGQPSSDSSQAPKAPQPQRPAPPPPPKAAAANPFATNPFASGATSSGQVPAPPPYAAAAALPPPPPYNAATKLAAPAPPAYEQSTKLPPPPQPHDAAAAMPPPPPYEAAVALPAAPQQAQPPAYESLAAGSASTAVTGTHKQQWQYAANLMDMLDGPLAAQPPTTSNPIAPKRTAPPPPPPKPATAATTSQSSSSPQPAAAPARANPFAVGGAGANPASPFGSFMAASAGLAGTSTSNGKGTSNPFAAGGLWGAVQGASEAAHAQDSSSNSFTQQSSAAATAAAAGAGAGASPRSDANGQASAGADAGVAPSAGAAAVTASDLDWLSGAAAGPAAVGPLQQAQQQHRKHHLHRHQQPEQEHEQRHHHLHRHQQPQQEPQHHHHHLRELRRHQQEQHQPLQREQGVPDMQKLQLPATTEAQKAQLAKESSSMRRRGSAEMAVVGSSRPLPATRPLPPPPPPNRNRLIPDELHLQVRLPPLRPKTSAPLKRLAAGPGCLFAAPVLEAGGLLQWSTPEADQGPGSAAGHHHSNDGVSGDLQLPLGGFQAAGEDMDSAPCAGLVPNPRLPVIKEGKPPKVCSMLLDAASGRLWAGCDDGRVCCWGVVPGAAAQLQHSWVAHRGSKVKALALTPWGKVITGSAGGGVRIWTYVRATGKSMPPMKWKSLKKQGNPPHSKVVRLVVAANGRMLWTAGKTTVSMWDAYSGEFIGTLKDQPEWTDMPDMLSGARPSGAYRGADEPGVINTAGGLDPRLVSGPFEGLPDEGDDGEDSDDDATKQALKLAGMVAGKAGKFFGKLGKKLLESSDSSNSRTAGYSPADGAATANTNDAAADKSERWGSVKELVACLDGTVWVAYKKGLLEQYSATAQRLYSSSAFKGGISTLAAVGHTIWVGGNDGRLWVLDSTTPNSQKLLRSWQAHVFPITAITAASGQVYSLGKDGSIRAWPAVEPEAALVTEWRAARAACVADRQLGALAVTWNVNEGRPERAALQVLLGERSRGVQLVVVGLQEVEMGTSSVARDAIITNLQMRGRLEAGNSNAQAWASEITAALHGGAAAWKRVGLRQMSGILVMVFARAELERHIGEVATASVACGVMGMGGNKGAVAVSFTLFRRRAVAVSSHFAAHQENVDARNADYAKIVRRLAFHRAPATDKEAAAEVADTTAIATDSPSEAAIAGGALNPGSCGASEEWGAGMTDAELLVWMGDFNYRVDAPPGFVPDLGNLERTPNEQLHDFVHAKISAGRHLDLVPGDQCTREARRGAVFLGLAEGPLTFLPTYKFEKGRESNRLQHFYDMGEKKRVPAWTDRIWFRGSVSQGSAFEVPAAAEATDVKAVLAGPDAYNSVMEISQSDHKPVYTQLSVTVPVLHQAASRAASVTALRRAAAAADQGMQPSAPSVQPASLTLKDGSSGQVTVANPCAHGTAAYAVLGPESGPLPPWVQVLPRSGLLAPGGSVKLGVWVSKGAAWHILFAVCTLICLGLAPALRAVLQVSCQCHISTPLCVSTLSYRYRVCSAHIVVLYTNPTYSSM